MATDEELKKLLGEDGEETPPEGDKPADAPDNGDAPKDPPEEDPEVKAKKEQLANLNKAVAEEQERLRKARKERKQTASGGAVEDEEELPKINLDDPAAKAWKREIQRDVAPVTAELEKAKEERRLFALRQFLEDKPALSRSPEKLRAMMETYDRLKTSTELTSEGILMDLEKAYAAEHSDELLRAARSARIDGARNDAFMSDIAISRGSSTYSDAKKEEKPIALSEDEKAQLAKWGMTPQEWTEMKKKYG